MLYVIRLFWVIPLLWASLAQADMAKRENDYGESLKNLVQVEMSSGLKERMRAVTETYHSEAFREEVKSYNSDLKGLLNIEGDEVEVEQHKEALDRPMLFISESVPMHTLRRYAGQLDAIGGGTMVLRGFIGGAKQLNPTLRFIATVLNRDEECTGNACQKFNVDMIIDPVLFSHHSVKRVPAFTLYEREAYTERCNGDASLERAEVVYGDASIKGLAVELSRIDKRTSVKRFIETTGLLK